MADLAYEIAEVEYTCLSIVFVAVLIFMLIFLFDLLDRFGKRRR